MDQEEILASVAREGCGALHENFFRSLEGLLFGGHLDEATLALGSAVVYQLALQCLIPGGDHLVQGELQGADMVVGCEILEPVVVVDVVHLDLVVLALLKVVLYVETFDPDWIKVVHDDFCHANLSPAISSLTIKHAHSICSCESIHIWKILACKREGDSVDQSCLVCIDRLIHCSQNSVIQISTCITGGS